MGKGKKADGTGRRTGGDGQCRVWWAKVEWRSQWKAVGGESGRVSTDWFGLSGVLHAFGFQWREGPGGKSKATLRVLLVGEEEGGTELPTWTRKQGSKAPGAGCGLHLRGDKPRTPRVAVGSTLAGPGP